MDEEFLSTIKQMHMDKSLGPDGFNPTLYQKIWSTMGDDVYVSCKRWLDAEKFLQDINSTHIVMIPKVQNAVDMNDLRSISSCNVIYKILSKVICNWLQMALLDLVNKAQSAFVKGRNIQHNVLIAFEAIII